MHRSGRFLITSVVVFLLLAFFMPFIMGMWAKHNYYKLIAFYNSQGDFHIQILEYQSNWYNARATLYVEALHTPLPVTFTTEQYIKYGPFIFTSEKNHPLRIELATIHSEIHFSPESLKNIQPSNPNEPVIRMDDDLSFSGEYHMHYKSAGFKMAVDDGKQLFLGEFSGDLSLWIYSHQMKGHISIASVSYNSPELLIAAPQVQLNFEEMQAKSGLWIGNSQATADSVTIQDSIGKTIILTDFLTVGDVNETDGKLNGTKRIAVNKLKLDEVEIGPVDLRLSIHDLNANAVAQLFSTYKKMFYSNERIQFAQQLFVLLPSLFADNASMKLDSLKVYTPDGDVLVNGEVEWPKSKPPAPQSIKEILYVAKAKGYMRISVVLAQELLGLAADLNYIGHRMANPEQAFLESQRNVTTLEKQNALLIAVLIQDNQLPKDLGMQLLSQIRGKVSYEDFLVGLNQLKAQNKITPSVMTMLDSQYQKIKIAGMSPDERIQYLEDQFADQFNGWVKNGYITQQDKDYVVNITYEGGAIKMNGKDIHS